MNELKAKAFELRLDILDLVYGAKSGHIGGDFSAIDIMTVLYNRHLNITPETASDMNRDLFVLSKGHVAEAYYAVLADRGFLNKADLMKQFCQFDSPYIGHPNNKLEGVEMNSGSLGHGLPVGVGMALASKMDKNVRRVYVLMGDGELAEGSIWEGFMAGGHYKLDNLCAIIDQNGLQISGSTKDVMSHENLAERIQNFGWHVLAMNGNDTDEIDRTLIKAKSIIGMPTCIIANTIKGFGGGDFMENKVSWHHKVPTAEEYQTIKKTLQEHKEAAEHE